MNAYGRRLPSPIRFWRKTLSDIVIDFVLFSQKPSDKISIATQTYNDLRAIDITGRSVDRRLCRLGCLLKGKQFVIESFRISKHLFRSAYSYLRIAYISFGPFRKVLRIIVTTVSIRLRLNYRWKSSQSEAYALCACGRACVCKCAFIKLSTKFVKLVTDDKDARQRGISTLPYLHRKPT